MTRDEFENLYEAPWQINGVYMDDMPCIFNVYRDMMRGAKTRDDMITVALVFRCFTWGGTIKQLQAVSDQMLERCHKIWQQGREAVVTDEEMPLINDILLPRIMLQAMIIGRECKCPEFYAGLQWIRAQNPFTEET